MENEVANKWKKTCQGCKTRRIELSKLRCKPCEGEALSWWTRPREVHSKLGSGYLFDYRVRTKGY